MIEIHSSIAEIRGVPNPYRWARKDVPPVARRMRAIRAWRNYPNSQEKFGEWLRGQPVESQWIGGPENTGDLSIQMAKLFCRMIPGMTLDFLYFGKMDAMPRKLCDELRPYLELIGVWNLLTPP